ncbi:MAG: hypothetical protein NVSMB6_00890 [Burkholderiaceae bacterium]
MPTSSSLRNAAMGIVHSFVFALALTAGVAHGGPIDDGASTMALPLTTLHAFTSRASELAMQAISVLGVYYKYGSNTPENGLDCSGLVQYVFRQASGAILPRTSEAISRLGQQVESHAMQPGDLVFYNTLKRGFSHVGIYLGDRQFIHAPSTGGRVRIESMDLTYWKNRFNGARRIELPQRESDLP